LNICLQPKQTLLSIAISQVLPDLPNADEFKAYSENENAQNWEAAKDDKRTTPVLKTKELMNVSPTLDRLQLGQLVYEWHISYRRGCTSMNKSLIPSVFTPFTTAIIK
jgi:hypothetical protein